jgi:type III restriction enzyme
LLTEEVAKVFGVPFEVIPFKESPKGPAPPPSKRHHVFALPTRAEYEIKYPRVEGYQQAIRNRVAIDWKAVATLQLDPLKIPPEVDMKATLPNNQGRYSITGPGKIESVDLSVPLSSGVQQLVFELAPYQGLLGSTELRSAAARPVPPNRQDRGEIPEEKVVPVPPADILDVFLSPYYGWVIERLCGGRHAGCIPGEVPRYRYETSRGPGSTADVDFWTSRDVREVLKSHVNFVVADTAQWEQSAAYIIDKHPASMHS